MKRYAYGLGAGIALVAIWWLYFTVEEKRQWQGNVPTSRHLKRRAHADSREWWEKALA